MRDLTAFPIKSSDIGSLKMGNDVSKEICIRYSKVVGKCILLPKCYLSCYICVCSSFVKYLNNK